MAHKICPRCQTPAPLEATFCGQCGRQYRTQFTAGAQAASSTVTPMNDAGFTGAPQNFAKKNSPALSITIVIMSAVVAMLILTVVNRGRHTETAGQYVRSVEKDRAATAPAEVRSAQEMVKQGEDPIEEEAKRVVERENRRLQTSPPPSAVGPDGRVHLRGGGSITKEQWEDANRRAHSSPQFRDPMPPPPVN